MKAARLFGPKDIRIVDEPIPVVEPGKILIKIEAVAICASDLRTYEDGHASGVVPDHPLIQGHEFSGRVEALGEGVDGPPLGTPVAVEPSWHCGECKLCKMGLTNICRNVIFPSFPQEDGAMREYMNVPSFAVVPTDESMDPIERALMEPFGVGVHAVRLANMQPTDRIAILGCGAIGMSTFVAARARGIVDIFCAEPKPDRRALPANRGAKLVTATAAQLEEAIGEAVDYPDVVFECSGDNEAVEQAMSLARPGGKVVVVGIPHPDEVTFDSTIPRRKELSVFFSRRSREILEYCVELVEAGLADLTDFPTLEYPCAKTVEAFKAAEERVEGQIRIIIRWD